MWEVPGSIAVQAVRKAVVKQSGKGHVEGGDLLTVQSFCRHLRHKCVRQRNCAIISSAHNFGK